MLIDLHHISKIYKAGDVEVPALINLTMKVEQGEFVAIIGQSGSGKTTLLDILGCLSHPTSGEYWLDGENVHELPEAQITTIRNKKIGFIFQTFHLLPRKTALENVQLPLMYARVPHATQHDRARELLTMVGLKDRLYHYSNQLSGGQQQRVAIARALANRPALLLADEPTGNLDSQSGNDILNVFDQLHQQGQTIIMITHDPLIAQRSERCITLSDGKIVSNQASHPSSETLV